MCDQWKDYPEGEKNCLGRKLVIFLRTKVYATPTLPNKQNIEDQETRIIMQNSNLRTLRVLDHNKEKIKQKIKSLV